MHMNGPMTKNTESSQDLFNKIHLLLESDLLIPEIEMEARQTLAKLKARGFEYEGSEVDYPDCIVCLHMALLSAANHDESPLH